MAADVFRITLAQLNPTVGDVAGNAARAREARAKAAADGADLVVLPELFMAGYPPPDLVREPAFQSTCRAAIETLAGETADGGPAVLIGTPWAEDDRLFNACALLDGGRIAALRFKANLPDGDQRRLFARGPAAGPVSVRGVRIGVAIGEDIRVEASSDDESVVETLAETGAEIIVVPSGSAYVRGGGDRRLSAAVAVVTGSDLPLVWLNQVGGQDGVVFDGASFALNADLSVATQLSGFAAEVVTLTWSRGADGWHGHGPVANAIDGDEADYAACVLGLRDHALKNGFSGVLLDLAGGISTVLSAEIAVDALGPDKVRGVLLPGRDTAPGANDDAKALAARLGITLDIWPIEAAVEGFEKILPRPLATGVQDDLLAHIRGTMLRALARTSGLLVVAASNTSDLPGRGTRHADDVSCGFAPLADISTVQVIRLAALRGRWTPGDARGRAVEATAPDACEG